MILKTIGIRISEAEEEAGADITDIGIEAYFFQVKRIRCHR